MRVDRRSAPRSSARRGSSRRSRCARSRRSPARSAGAAAERVRADQQRRAHRRQDACSRSSAQIERGPEPRARARHASSPSAAPRTCRACSPPSSTARRRRSEPSTLGDGAGVRAERRRCVGLGADVARSLLRARAAGARQRCRAAADAHRLARCNRRRRSRRRRCRSCSAASSSARACSAKRTAEMHLVLASRAGRSGVRAASRSPSSTSSRCTSRRAQHVGAHVRDAAQEAVDVAAEALRATVRAICARRGAHRRAARATSPRASSTLDAHSRARRLPPRPGALAPATTSSSSTSRASRRGRCRSGASSAARCATSPACCARSTTRRSRRCATGAPARRGRARRSTPWARAWTAWVRAAFLGGYLERVGERALRARRATRDRSCCSHSILLEKVHLRNRLRAQQPTRLGRDPAMRACARRWRRRRRDTRAGMNGPVGAVAAGRDRSAPVQRGHARAPYDKLGAQLTRSRRRRLLRGVGAERRARVGHRRLQRLERARHAAAARTADRASGKASSRRRRRATSTSTASARAQRLSRRQGRSVRAAPGDAAADRLDRLAARLHEWSDGDVDAAARAAHNALDAPISIYEVHLGSWMRVPEDGNRSLTYRELAPQLAEHVKRARLHARRADAGHGAPVLRLVGLPGHRLLRADRALRHAAGLHVPRRPPAPARASA